MHLVCSVHAVEVQVIVPSVVARCVLGLARKVRVPMMHLMIMITMMITKYILQLVADNALQVVAVGVEVVHPHEVVWHRFASDEKALKID